MAPTRPRPFLASLLIAAAMLWLAPGQVLTAQAAPDPAQIPQPLPEDGPADPEFPIRTVLEIEVVPVDDHGTAGTPFRLVAVAGDGPVESRKLDAVDRDDLPMPLSWTASLLDREHRVAEIHFFRNDGSEGSAVPHQIAFLDGDAATQVELARGFTWALRWVEARDETEHVVDGETVYRKVQP